MQFPAPSFPNERELVPEWLDEMPPDHPDAAAARRDLRKVNWLMGNERWIIRRIAAEPELASRGIVEIGAGEGYLARRLAEQGPVTACDLAPRPANLPEPVHWLQGDCFESLPGLEGSVLVASLFLHHFDTTRLARIGQLAARFDRLLWCEPHRARLPLALATLLLPVVNRVTRHDMPVSIRAGFVPGELSRLCGLGSEWEVKETVIFRGALRLEARRRP